MADIKWRFWQDIAKRLVDRQDDTWAERVEAYPPKVLMTDNDGIYGRLRVDNGQTGFFAGREFRSLIPLNIASGTTQTYRITSPINFILYSYTVELVLSQVKLELIEAATPSGTWTNIATPLATNSMTSASGYVGQIIIATGGTITGGVIYDATDVITGSNINKAIVQQTEADQPLGFHPNTYYIKIQNTDGAAAIGYLKLRWEERP